MILYFRKPLNKLKSTPGRKYPALLNQGFLMIIAEHDKHTAAAPKDLFFTCIIA